LALLYHNFVNISTVSPVRICLQTENARNASTKFRKTSESKKAEKDYAAGFSNPPTDLKCHTLAAASRAGVALRGDGAFQSRRGRVYHQHEVLYIIRNLLRYIIKPQERCTLTRDEIQGR